MLYQLSTGYTIEISLEDYLSFSDEELENLKGSNYGLQINNPKYASVINKPGKKSKVETNDISEKEIYKLSTEEKRLDQDANFGEE